MNLDLGRKLDAERFAVKASNDELMHTQNKIRMLEIDLKETRTNYNKVFNEFELLKQSTEQVEFDNQRRMQYDLDLKQLEQEFSNSLTKEKQMQDRLDQLQNENKRLTDELQHINSEYETIKTKLIDYEEQLEGAFIFKHILPTNFPII